MRKLFIENFGPVKNADLELRDMNLFIGEQSIGKSTIAKLITILTDYYNLTVLISRGLDGWINCLKSYNLEIYSKKDYKILFDFEEMDVRFHLVITNENMSFYILSQAGRKVTNIERVRRELMKLKPFYHKDTFLKELYSTIKQHNDKNTRLDNLITSIEGMLCNSIYIPAERIVYSLYNRLQPALNLMKDAIPNNFLRFMIELTNAQSKYQQFDASLLNVRYLKENADDFIIDIKSEDKMPLSIASSGIQSTMPLLLVLEYAMNYREYSSVVIEEPEANLFPAKQVELLRYILRKVKSEKRIVTITTHSPYLLSAINNSLYAGSLNKEFGNAFDSVCSEIPRLMPGECSVYSLGQSINEGDVYCKSLLDDETGMISVNALDGISFNTSSEFEELEDAYIEFNKRAKQ